MAEWIVSSDESGYRLVTFLNSRLGNGFSARTLKRAIESNCCQINGRVERFASAKVGQGDHISFAIEESVVVHAAHQVESSRILFEDDYLLIYDKPAGVSCDEAGILSILKPYCPTISLVHRLDRQTTGLLLLAKQEGMLNALVSQFKQLQVHKKYKAIVDGILEKNQGVIENYLGKKQSYGGQTIWGSVKSTNGLFAHTEWKRLKKGESASLVACYPKTGRTHQLRVHLAELGHPILGDFQYGKRFECPYTPKRYLLHAEEIEFCHPQSGQKLHFKAPLPEDFLKAQKALFK